MKYKKALLTVGAIGVLGTAGSFGTFAAFTDALPAEESVIDTGDIEITGTFAIPDISNLVTGDPAQPQSMTITNTGDRASQIWIDQDGPVGNLTDLLGPAGGFSDNLLAENLIVTASYDVLDSGDNVIVNDFPLDQSTRLWKVNRRGLAPVPGVGTTSATNVQPLALQPGQKLVISSTVNLRERGANGLDDAGLNVDTSALDNAMQNLSINQTLHVRAIEATTQAQQDFGAPNTTTFNPSVIPFDDGIGTPAGAAS
jgi:hypothetical protein